MPQKKTDSFVADSFTPDNDSFVADSFTPDQPEEKGLLSHLWEGAVEPLWKGPSRLGKSLSEYINPNREADYGLRSLASAYLESLGNTADSLTSPISLGLTALSAGTAPLVKAGMPIAAKAANWAVRGLSTPIAAHGLKGMYEGYEHGSPAEFATSALETVGGGLGMTTKVPRPRAIEPEVLPPEAPIPPRIAGLLEAPDDPFIVGDAGVAQRESLVTPQERMRLQGVEIGPEGPEGIPQTSPPDRFVNLGEVAERERQANLDYTDLEHFGGNALRLERPIMDIPPESGDVRLGFQPETNPEGSLGYPLDIVPNRLRPRIAQTVTRALAGDEFARSVEPNRPIQFESEPTPKETPMVPTRELKGGTAAIEPGEPILPTAARAKAASIKDATGLNVNKVTMPKDTPKTVEPIVADGVQKFVQSAEQPSILFKSIYSQLGSLGDAGVKLVHLFQRAAQNRSEFDAAWTEPLFKVASKLSKPEFKNFGAYVEGRLPIPNERVQAAVDSWKSAQTMMGDTAVSEKLHLKRGEEVIPFEKMEGDYWPHIPVEVLTKKSIIDKLVAGGMPRAEAVKVALRFENTGEIFIRGQYSRLKDSFAYRDDFDVAIQHGRSMSKRIANHMNLGPKDIAGKGTEGVANLIEDTTNPNLALKLAKRLAGRDELPSARLVNGLNQARKWMSLTSLPNFTLPNVILGQTMNAYMAAISRHPIAVMGEVMNLFKASYRDEIRASGVFNSFNRSLTEELSGVDPFQIGAGERINRSVAAAIGRSIVKEAFADFQTNPANPFAQYFLRTLLSRDPATIQAITPEMERFAAGRMAEITQGLNNPGNLPYGWSTPVNTYGSVATQLMLIFKKVGFQITKTVKDTMVANPKVAIPAWVAMSQIAGEMVGDVKSAITGKDRPEELANRIASNWGNAFMLGLPWDLATSAQYGPTALIASAAGPAYSKASEFAYDVYKSGENVYNEKEDPISPVRNFFFRNLPIPGRERIKQSYDEQ